MRYINFIPFRLQIYKEIMELPPKWYNICNYLTYVNQLSMLHEFRGKQDLCISAKPDALSALLDIAKIQSTKASNGIEGIFTSDDRLQELVMEKTEPRSRSEEEIAGYREVLSMIHENLNFVKAMRSYGMEYTEFIFPPFPLYLYALCGRQ